MRALRAVPSPSGLDRDEVFVLAADSDGGVTVLGGEHLLILFADHAHSGGAMERVKRGIDVGARRVGELGAEVGDADPPAGTRPELGIHVSNAVLGGCLGWHVIRVPEYLGEAQVGAIEIA